MTTLYGIPNCDTVKKARQHLQEQGVDFTFHNYKKDGVPAAQLQAWIATHGWDKVLNRAGTTWRRLDDAAKAAVHDAASAHAFLLDNPSAIKRPIIDWGQGRSTLGFKPEEWPLG